MKTISVQHHDPQLEPLATFERRGRTAAPTSRTAPPVVIAGKILAAAPLGDLSKFRATAVNTLALLNSSEVCPIQTVDALK